MQENQPKISCICITNNRVGMLNNAIKFFDKQTYYNKELVILYGSDDVATKQYAKQWDEVCRVNTHITNSPKHGFEIYSTDGKKLTTLQGADKVKIKVPEKGWLMATPTGKIILTQEARLKDTVFSLDLIGGLYLIRSPYGPFLSTHPGGAILAKSAYKTAEKFSITFQNDKTFVIETPQGSFMEFPDESNHLRHGHLWKESINGNLKAKIRFVELDSEHEISLGNRRNIALNYSTGEYMAVWDDDDYHAPERLEIQLNAILNSQKVACTLTRLFMYDHTSGKSYATSARRCGWEGSLVCHKDYMVNYEDLDKGEDTSVLLALLRTYRLAVIMEPQLYIYNVHGNNTWNRDHFRTLINMSVPLNGSRHQYVAERALIPVQEFDYTEEPLSEEDITEAVG